MQTVDTEAEVLLEIRNLSIHYPISIGTVKAVNDVSLDVFRGEVLGIVGESGCGKSTLGLSILNLQKPPGRIVAGSVRVDGVDILALEGDGIRNVRGPKIGMIFQNPLTSLDPLMSIKDHFIETLRAHEPKIKDDEALKRAETILEDLGIEKRRLSEYPFQLSGGMRQRIMIGLTLVLDPKLLLADEPTTALDVTVQAQILELIAGLQAELRTAVIIITHDLGIVAEVADETLVMYSGQVMERGSTEQVFRAPQHPYTWGLLTSVTGLNRPRRDRLVAIPGAPPSLIDLPAGCPFHPRCPYAGQTGGLAGHSRPALREASPGHWVACHLTDQSRARVFAQEVQPAL